jgi:hypothetical protein
MPMGKQRRPAKSRSAGPQLRLGMRVQDFDECYWMKEDLINFARELGLRTDGYKPEVMARIRRRLLGLAPLKDTRSRETGPRDSDKPLTRDTPVVNYKNDERTREFFKRQIGPEFHFTYHVNQYRLKNPGLTYGDMIDEWLAENERRKRKDYKPRLAKHGEYNIFVRAFFADPVNHGKSMREAAAAWNKVKPSRDRSYGAFKASRQKRGDEGR